MKKVPLHVLALAMAPVFAATAVFFFLDGSPVWGVAYLILTFALIACGLRLLSIERKRRAILGAPVYPLRREHCPPSGQEAAPTPLMNPRPRQRNWRERP